MTLCYNRVMKATKINPLEVFNLKRKTKLNRYWEAYFHSLSVEFSKTFFEIIKEPLNVRLVNCETIDFDTYNENLGDNTLIQFFKIYPHNNLGFYTIPYETFELLLTNILGGKTAKENFKEQHDLTKIDQSIIHIIINKLISILTTPLQDGLRNIQIELLDFNTGELVKKSSNIKQSICVQEYYIQIGEEIYPFDLVFTSGFLERFTLL